MYSRLPEIKLNNCDEKIIYLLIGSQKISDKAQYTDWNNQNSNVYNQNDQRDYVSQRYQLRNNGISSPSYVNTPVKDRKPHHCGQDGYE